MSTAAPVSDRASREGRLDAALGILLSAVLCLIIAEEAGWNPARSLLPLPVCGLLGVLAFRVKVTRLAFIVTGIGLTAALVATNAAWWTSVEDGLHVAAFVAAFFTALSTLRNAASTSPSIRRCGQFLAAQPPGWRYLALTAGGQLFALLLNYGAIQLLGAMAMASAQHEQNEQVRTIRIRRMLLAVERGFLATLPWSPLSFAIAIGTTIIPGATWGEVILPSMVTGLILVGTGWALDTILKPRLKGPRPPRPHTEEGWRSVVPIFALLAVFFCTVAVLHLLTDIRIVGIVVFVVPVISAGWIALQDRADDPFGHLRERAARYVRVELPGYRGELTLLMMAAYIGTVGGALLVPVIEAAGIDLSTIPATIILVALVWIIPLAGQFAMNPILAASLIAPVLPGPAALGVTPTAVLVAVTAGWALGGASSPFTATNLLVGSFSGRTAWHIGLVWNGPFTVIAGVLLSAWVAVYANL